MGARPPRAPDGDGFPFGIANGDIPLEARILAVADAYEAMTSDRPYKAAMSQEDACEELRRCAGTQFDPRLVEAFIAALDSSGPAGERAASDDAPTDGCLAGLVQLLVNLAGDLAGQARHRLELLARGAEEALGRAEVPQQRALAGRARCPAARRGSSAFIERSRRMR